MKLRIQHVTRYRYRGAVSLQSHRLMLVPRGTHDLTVQACEITLTPAAETWWSQDVFGNVVTVASFAQPTDELVIASDVTVEQLAPAWPVFRIAPGAHTYPFDYSAGEIADLGALLHPQHADPDGRLHAWAHSFIHAAPTDTLSLLRDINTAIADTIDYRTRDQEGTQGPLETLALASGSCRDLSALLLDALRHLGFGARAVSGYLFDPDNLPDESGSTHAWVEVYLPSAGWIAFDPTHRRLGSANLIPVAVGRCNDQLLPITGGYLGAAGDFLDMDVHVTVSRR